METCKHSCELSHLWVCQDAYNKFFARTNIASNPRASAVIWVAKENFFTLLWEADTASRPQDMTAVIQSQREGGTVETPSQSERAIHLSNFTNGITKV